MDFSKQALDEGKRIESTIVPHSRFQEVAQQILSAAQIGCGTGLFSGIRVTAPSGAGKSALLAYVGKIFQDSFGHGDHVPVITASLKEDPAVSQVQDELLSCFNYALRSASGRVTNNDINKVLVNAISRHQVRLIAIDEFQHVFISDRKVVTVLLDWIKRLMNLTRVPVVVVGTERLDALEGFDEQFTSRIPTVARLSYFKLNAEWKGFLMALANECKAVDMSPLFTDYGQELFNASRGSPRAAKGIVIRALCIAITQGEQRLSRDTMIAAYQMLYGQVDVRENPFAGA